jgi:hypothetical protein
MTEGMVNVNGPPRPDSEIEPDLFYGRQRRPDRIYFSRTFGLRDRRARGHPARYVTKVFDELAADSRALVADEEIGTMEVVRMVNAARERRQLKLMVAREAGEVRKLELQEIPFDPAATWARRLLTLDGAQAQRLVGMLRAVDNLPLEEGETQRLDDSVIEAVFSDTDAMNRLYGSEPERFRALIENDASAEDVIAVARRRAAVEHFRRLLDDPEFFDATREGGSREAVWQRFLEANPWILGVSLAGQLLTSWDDHKLEQTVAGHSVTRAGKRADALLQTNGRIRALVFAEIKHHETPLLAPQPYRPGAWAPSSELSGGVAQIQQTVQSAHREIGERLRATGIDGAETGEEAFLVRPRSYLIVGNLAQLLGSQGGVHVARHRCFELFRRNLYEPEIVTFDELLARAEWHVSLAER